jgi:hypothetical protein
MQADKLSEEEVLAQSKAAFNQWEDKWKEHARINGDKYKIDGLSSRDLLYSGYGKTLVICGMGTSLEDHIDTLKKYKDKPGIDICCCDKGFKTLMDNGIKPDMVFVADAVVDYDKWAKQYIEETSEIKLMASITCNPKWPGNWRGPVYFYVNKDNIKSEEIFGAISGCTEMIPASSNVGNSAIVYTTQIMGYSQTLLVGYDFSWEVDRNYYAFEDNEKRYWMKTGQGYGINNELVYTSGNLHFSCRWLQDFVNGPLKAAGVKVINCSNRGIMNIPKHNLEKLLDNFKQFYPTPDLYKEQRKAKAQTRTLLNIEQLKEIAREKEVFSVEVTYGNREVLVA